MIDDAKPTLRDKYEIDPLALLSWHEIRDMLRDAEESRDAAMNASHRQEKVILQREDEIDLLRSLACKMIPALEDAGLIESDIQIVCDISLHLTEKEATIFKELAKDANA